jgi:hypothetical protein
MKVKNWTFIDNENGVEPKCDIVEVQCQRWFWFNYRFMHTQIAEKSVISCLLYQLMFRKELTTNKFNVNETLSEYNLYWILIDATSSSMFKRAMRQTRDVLMDKMQAIEFPYLNKVCLLCSIKYMAYILKDLDPCKFTFKCLRNVFW